MQNVWFWALIGISIENLRQIEVQEIGESIELKRKEYLQMHTGIDSFLRAPNETEWILQLEHKRRESIDEKNETEDSFQFRRSINLHLHQTAREETFHRFEPLFGQMNDSFIYIERFWGWEIGSRWSSKYRSSLQDYSGGSNKAALLKSKPDDIRSIDLDSTMVSWDQRE